MLTPLRSGEINNNNPYTNEYHNCCRETVAARALSGRFRSHAAPTPITKQLLFLSSRASDCGRISDKTRFGGKGAEVFFRPRAEMADRFRGGHGAKRAAAREVEPARKAEQ